MRNLWNNLKEVFTRFFKLIYSVFLNRVLAGVVLIVPIGVTYYVVMFVYSILLIKVTPLGGRLFDKVPTYFAPLASISIILLVIFALGLLTRFVIGRKVVSLIEWILEKIPVIKTIYGAVKKIVEVFLSTSSEGKEKKIAVIIDFPFQGVKSVGIVTNRIEIDGIGECYTLFVPTVPNPTSGYFEMVPVDKVSEGVDASTEEIISMLLSGGVVTPEAMRVSDASEKRESSPSDIGE